MAVDLGGAKQVGWCNPRSGTLHPLKLSVYPSPDWLPLYVSDEDPGPEHRRLIEVIRQGQQRNWTLIRRSKRFRRRINELEAALKRRNEQRHRMLFLIGELEDQLAGSRVRMDDWRNVANARTTRILELEAQLNQKPDPDLVPRAEWHKANDARRAATIEVNRLIGELYQQRICPVCGNEQPPGETTR